jgi:hypothetical protein
MRRSFGRFAVILGTSAALAACSISASTSSDSTTSTSTATSASTSTPPTGLHTLQSERGFALIYPTDWTQKDSPDGLVAAFVTSPSEGSDDTFSENVNVVIDPAGARLSLAEYAQANLQAISTFEQFQLIEQGDLSVGELTSRTVEYTAHLNGRDLRLWQIMFVAEGSGFVITYTGTPESFEGFRDEAEAIVASFRLI